MTHLETRGERLARAHHKPRWIGTEPPERDGQLDMWDAGRYHHHETTKNPLDQALEQQAMNVPKHETFEKAPSVWLPHVVGVSFTVGLAGGWVIAWIVGAL